MFDASKYIHSHNWTTRSELRQHLHKHLNAPAAAERAILEIGSYEGLTACYFSDELLDHPESQLVCVDPFDLNDSTTPLTSETEQRFLSNIARSKNSSKIRHFKMYSRTYLTDAQRASPMLFDLIYIDGSHVPGDIAFDITHSYPLLKPGGIMWMDDYHFGNGYVKLAMDETLATLSDYTIIHKDYQIAIRKHPSTT